MGVGGRPALAAASAAGWGGGRGGGSVGLGGQGPREGAPPASTHSHATCRRCQGGHHPTRTFSAPHSPLGRLAGRVAPKAAASSLSPPPPSRTVAAPPLLMKPQPSATAAVTAAAAAASASLKGGRVLSLPVSLLPPWRRRQAGGQAVGGRWWPRGRGQEDGAHQPFPPAGRPRETGRGRGGDRRWRPLPGFPSHLFAGERERAPRGWLLPASTGCLPFPVTVGGVSPKGREEGGGAPTQAPAAGCRLQLQGRRDRATGGSGNTAVKKKVIKSG